MSETEKAYLAGFFDGEGCVHISKKAPRAKVGAISPEHKLVVIFAQSEQSCLQHWRARVNMGQVYATAPRPDPEPRGIKATKQMYAWQLTGREAESVLRQMLPYLVVKKDQAELALKFRSTQQQQTTAHRNGLPVVLVELREQYRLSLMLMKKTGDPIELRQELQNVDEILSCQMELPGF